MEENYRSTIENCKSTMGRWRRTTIGDGEQQINNGELQIGDVAMEENSISVMVKNQRSKDSKLENHRSAIEYRRWRRILDWLLRDRESE